MPLPGMTAGGELPPGVHGALLSEVLDRFGAGPSQPRIMARRLERIYYWLRRLAALGAEQATIEHWQITRDGRESGIVEVAP